MKVYIVLEIIPVILGTTIVSSYEEIRFIGLTMESARDYRNGHDYYDSTIRIWNI